MLSYRHAFHAGNHADVLKHLCEVLILDYLCVKADKPFAYIDTHAGAGLYALDHQFSETNREFASGIEKLWNKSALPEPLLRYLEVIRAFNPKQQLRAYPGSPVIAEHILPDTNQLHLCELHPRDGQSLTRWAHEHKHIHVYREDGFTKLASLLPPPQRRGMIMIDPPYEVKTDYQRVVESCQDALKRFATGVYVVWYPLLRQPNVQKTLANQSGSAWMTKQLQRSCERYVRAELLIDSEPTSELGMIGSGVFVINPPWPLLQQMQSSLPILRELLGVNASASFNIDYQGLS